MTTPFDFSTSWPNKDDIPTRWYWRWICKHTNDPIYGHLLHDISCEAKLLWSEPEKLDDD